MPMYTAEPVKVVNTTTTGDQFHPSIAPLATGGYVVAWTSGTGSSSAIYSQRYDASGNQLGGETLLFQELSPLGARVGGVVGLADGSYVVSFDNGRQERTFFYDNVWAVHVAADGHVLGDAIVVAVSLAVNSGGDTTTTAGQVYAAPDGGFYVGIVHMSRPTPVSTWFTDLQRYDADGNAVGTPFHVAGGFPNASIAVLPDGNIVAAWDVWGGPTGPHVEWNVLTPDGQVIAQGLEHESAFARDVDPSITVLQDGRWVMAWSHEPDTVLSPPDSTPKGIYASVMDASGQAAHAPMLLDAPQASDIVVLADGGFLAYWSQTAANGNSEYFAREYSADGNALSDTFAIAAPQVAKPEAYLNNLPDVAALSDGSFVVASDAPGTGEDIYVQEFSIAPPVQGKTIEGTKARDDLQGTAGADTLRAYNGKDMLFGGLGNDILDGGNGIDTALFTGSRSQYVITRIAGGFTVAGPDGTDTLLNIERLQFSNDKGALDLQLGLDQAVIVGSQAVGTLDAI